MNDRLIDLLYKKALTISGEISVTLVPAGAKWNVSDNPDCRVSSHLLDRADLKRSIVAAVVELSEQLPQELDD